MKHHSLPLIMAQFQSRSQNQFKYKRFIYRFILPTLNLIILMQEDNVEKVQYFLFQQLVPPSGETIAQASIQLGFNSKQWFIQFQTLTNLRQANRHYASLFINELLPLNYKNILAQVENLRSNNSKQALTLVSQIFEHQKLDQVQVSIIRALVASMMVKSASQKGFLKSQAVKGLNFLPTKWNDGVIEQLCLQTQAKDGQIAQLAIRLLAQTVQNNKNFESDGKFLKNLSLNLNGKRAVLQKRAKQILNDLKKRQGEQKLQLKIKNSQQLLEQQSNTLRRELKQKQSKAKGPSLKDFIKQKKQEQ